MDSVAEQCAKVAVFSEGRIARFASPREVFYDEELLAETELDMPSVAKVVKELEAQGIGFDTRPIRKNELIAALTERRAHE